MSGRIKIDAASLAIVMSTKGILLLGWVLACGVALCELHESSAAPNPSVFPERQCSASVNDVPASRLATLARGFNLTGWVDGKNVRRPDKAALSLLRRSGMTHVRLPVNAEAIMNEFTSERDVGNRLAEVDRALADLTALNFGVTLDLHPGARFERLHVDEPDRVFDVLKRTWSTLAGRYAKYSSAQLFFELLNEPAVSAQVWNRQGPLLLASLRQAAPTRTLIYGSANYQQIAALEGLPDVSVRNVVYAVHFYAPMAFTHQGLDWSDDPLRYLGGVPFPLRSDDPKVDQILRALTVTGRSASAALLQREATTSWTEERIDEQFTQAAAWAARHARPLIVNEFGVLRWKAPAADRARWLSAVRRAAEQKCIGWTHWEYADGFGFMERIGEHDIPDPLILDALLNCPFGAERCGRH